MNLLKLLKKISFGNLKLYAEDFFQNGTTKRRVILNTDHSNNGAIIPFSKDNRDLESLFSEVNKYLDYVESKSSDIDMNAVKQELLSILKKYHKNNYKKVG